MKVKNKSKNYWKSLSKMKKRILNREGINKDDVMKI